MTFLSPLFLLGGLAAAIPVVLHLLKREPEPRVKFAAVTLLKDAPVEYTERRRLRELVLLALRVAAFVLLALAFARPFLPPGVALGSAGVTMVALDTSYSMAAPGAFDRARRLARAAVGRVPTGDPVGVVTFSDLPALVASPAPDHAFALSAIDAARPGFGATRYRGALGAAVQALGGRRGTIVVVTDLQESGWDAGDRVSVPGSARVEIADVGPLPPDLAVTALRAAGDRIVATVHNSGDRPRSTRARLTLDGRSAAEAAVTIGPRASVDVEFPGAAKRQTASSVAVAIDDPGGMPADDVRYAVSGSANRPSIVIVTTSGDLGREAFYVQQALSAATASGGFQLVGVSAAQLSTWDAARLAPDAAVVLLSTRGLERRGRVALEAYVKGGGGMLVAVGPDIDGDVVGDVLGPEAPLRIAAGNGKPEDRALAPADVRHPIFQPFGGGAATLGLVKFHTVARIGGSGCQTVARFTTGEAALLECMPGDGRALVLASDLGNRWNDFPLHTTFLPFLHETVRYLASGRGQADEYLVSDVPAGIPPTPGIAVMPGAGPQFRKVAVNVDPRESDPTRLSAAEFQAAVTSLKDVGAVDAQVDARQQEDRQQLWRYVLALMMATLAIESVVASRTA
jgi:Aerotolerance regulator N-terminal/von Willebrand factor type A domain